MFKYKWCVIVLVVALFFQSQAFAVNCKWYQSGSEYRQYEISLPERVKLKDGPVGPVLFEVLNARILGINGTDAYISCDGRSDISLSVSLVSGMRLADGLERVYETGVPGIGLRLLSNDNVIPYNSKYLNVSGVFPWDYNGAVTFQFIRTGMLVKDGVATINARFRHVTDVWNDSDLVVSGTIKIENERRISSCVSVGDTLIHMGRVDASEVGRRAARSFLLQAQCNHEGASGQPLPVKVYFEGDSPGTGRLNLLSGGAQGIEISLTDDSGKPLPFEKSNALNMVSPNDTSGKYTLRANAAYIKKQSEKIVPGQANATLNYIFEYE